MVCRLRGGPAGVCLIALLGCNPYDSDLLRELEGAATTPMVPRPDAAPSCRDEVEVCNGEDDDCDGTIDEGAERDCVFPHSTAVCVGSGCVIVDCEGGYADCNTDVADGCEQRSDQIACGMCGKNCSKPDEPTGGVTGQPTNGGDEDAGTGEDPPDPPDDPPDDPPVCTPSPERCDNVDNDCNGQIDDGRVCAIAMCVSTTPSYRGSACDECVCENCAQLVALCQNHSNATWSMQCRDLVECVVVESRAGACPNADCYQGGAGPCADETVAAAGGGGLAQVAVGCAPGSPPAAACAAAINYRDQCTTTVCASACAQ